MPLPAIKSRPRFDQPAVASSPEAECHADPTLDFESWDLFSCWKEQQKDRFGGGNSAPAIPRSQRQYDGDNCFDYCEVLVLR
jgi:hypothetical protein